jgi:hypothetical protein
MKYISPESNHCFYKNKHTSCSGRKFLAFFFALTGENPAFGLAAGSGDCRAGGKAADRRI